MKQNRLNNNMRRSGNTSAGSVARGEDNHRADCRAGVTLIELLTVLVIISILAGLLLAALALAKRRAYETRAKTEVRELTRAWYAYWMTYGKWPGTLGTETNAEMTAVNIGYLLGNNSQNIRFLDPKINVRTDGFKDPWGKYYRVDFSQTRSIGQDVYEATAFLPLYKRYQYDHR